MTLIYIGYEITAAVYSSFVLMLACIFLERKKIAELLREHVDRNSLICLAVILAFFLIFALLFVWPNEQLYFDENIYQGIALNILHNGNALWCQFGTGYLHMCYANSLYHDPVGWAAFIAIAFAVAGIGTQTAYGLELLVGALSIVFMFLLASVLIKRKDFAVISALAMAVMPGLFIWSRTQSDFDLPFMMLTILSFFLFVVFTKRKSLYSLGAFAFSLVLVSYIRIEAVLLLPLFAIFALTIGDTGVRETVRERIAIARRAFRENTKALVVLLIFIVLLLPEIYYITLEAQYPEYGQHAGQGVLSLANFNNNVVTNFLFITGQLNLLSNYPAEFHYTIFFLALLGILALIFRKRMANRLGLLLLLLLWFLTYFGFYSAFYAGAALFGVDSRFMLQVLPPLCLLAAFGLVSIGDAAVAIVGVANSKKNASTRNIVHYATLLVVVAVLLVFPFYLLVPVVSVPPNTMPQQGVVLPAVTTFYNNHNVVPNNCLVFSFTPEIWQEANLTGVQVGYLNGANSTLESTINSYSCLVFDYGYWCEVAPYNSQICSSVQSRYKLQNLLTPQQQNGTSIAFYKILNYT